MASGRAVDFLGQALRGREPHPRPAHDLRGEPRAPRQDAVVERAHRRAPGVPKNIAAYFELITEFQPEVVISDFESWTYLYGKTHRLPILSIDNMQIINRRTLPDEILDGHQRRVPAHQGVRQGQAAVLRPVLHHDVLPAADAQGPHPAVPADPAAGDPRGAAARAASTCSSTQTGEGNAGARGHARADRARVPDLRHAARSRRAEVVEGNLRYRPFSEAEFIDDLASLPRRSSPAAASR